MTGAAADERGGGKEDDWMNGWIDGRMSGQVSLEDNCPSEVRKQKDLENKKKDKGNMWPKSKPPKGTRVS